VSSEPDVGRGPRVAGWIGLAGCAVALATDAATALLVEDYDYVADTISDLAEGPWAWLQDAGLCAFALGLAANAVSFWRQQRGDRRGMTGASLLLLAAGTIVAIALYDAYGPREGWTVHYVLVVSYAVLHFAASLLLGSALQDLAPWAAKASVANAFLFLLAAVPFYWLPDHWDGIYERGLAALVLGWLTTLSIVRLRRLQPD